MKFEKFALRPFQIQAISALQRHCHVLCVAGTGSGKSLIYEKWAAEIAQRTLLISPLVSLIRQQKTKLVNLGDRVRILSPESLEFSHRWREIQDWRPDFLVVDECHCLEEWGVRFRPAYSQIPNWAKVLNPRHSLWLSATMTGSARQSLRKSLSPWHLHEMGEFELPRHLQVQSYCLDYPQRFEYLRRRLSQTAEPGLIFVNTRRWSERLVQALKRSGLKNSMTHYHAGMSQEEKISVENGLRNGAVQIVVATSAFGMGMDFDSLKWMVVWQPPWSLLGLAQAMGRIARNGQGGQAVLFWSERDFTDTGFTSVDPLAFQQVSDWYRQPDQLKQKLVDHFH